MNVQLLIDSIVRQTTVLIAQLATSGGIRAPLAHIANHVFVELARELEAQGVSRKVSADMFGMALRAYQRKLRRLGESSTEQGRSLWEAVLDFLENDGVRTRAEVLSRFQRDEPETVRGILRDLTESGLVFATGSGHSTVYRAATTDELGSIRRRRNSEGFDELVWALVYREGPIKHDELLGRAGVDAQSLDVAVTRLTDAGRIMKHETPSGVEYASEELVLPVDDPVGWEAAVLDHYQAVVQTICARLRPEDAPSATAGGSTYTFDVWDGHPLADDVRELLTRFRADTSELRQRVEAHNAKQGMPGDFDRVVVYAGQSVIRDSGSAAEDEGAP